MISIVYKYVLTDEFLENVILLPLSKEPDASRLPIAIERLIDMYNIYSSIYDTYK